MEQYLLNHRSKKGEKDYTHTSMGAPLGCFKFPDEEEFLDLYAQEIQQGKVFHLTEKHLPDRNQIIIDLDIKQTMPERQDELSHAISGITNNLVDFFNMTLVNPNTTCFILQRPSPYSVKEGEYKDGVHIQFPFIVTEYWYQHYMRRKFIQCILPKYFQEIEHTNSLKDIYDESVIERNNWMLYGSTKPNTSPYQLVSIKPSINSTHLYPYVYSQSELVKLLSIRHNIGELTVYKEYEIEIMKMEYKTMMLSKSKPQSNQSSSFSSSSIQKEAIREILNLIDVKRCDNQSEWFEIGAIVYNTDKTAFDIWKEWSQKSNKFHDQGNEALMNKYWQYTYPNYLGVKKTIKSLIYYARLDNPNLVEAVIEKYNLYGIDEEEQILESGLSLNDSDLADVLNYFYKDRIRKDVKYWYLFNNHKWSKLASDAKLYPMLSFDIANKYKELATKYNTRSKNFEKEYDDPAIKKLNESEDKANKVYGYLKKHSKKRDIISEYGKFIEDPLFKDKLDDNKNLIGFDNGVFDLEKMEFRSGELDDYVSLSVRYDYCPTYSDKIGDLKQFLSDIQPVAEQLEYMLLFLSTTLSGNNNDELFHIFTGNSRNGKSKLRDLLACTLGDYFGSIDVAMLTKQRPGSNVGQPDILALRRKRLIIGSEPEGNDKINGSFMKIITGNDLLVARELYCNEYVEFYPHFKVALLCNDIPKMDKDDPGVWSRCRVINFPSKFVENPTKPNEKKIDTQIGEKLKSWNNDFMLLLIEYYQKYKQMGLKITNNISMLTNQYKSEHDVFYYFIEECFNKGDGKEYTSKYTELKEIFRMWYYATYHEDVQDKKIDEFRKYIEKKYGAIKSIRNKDNKMVRGIRGIRIKSDIKDKLEADYQEYDMESNI